MRRSIARIVVSGVALTAFGAVLAVPATADVADVSVAVGAEGLLTGCRYTVTAGVTDAVIAPGSVFFVLSGGVVPGNGERIPGEAVHHPENNTVTATWTPTRVGGQNLVAIQSEPGRYTSTKFTSIEVIGTGLDTGSSCQRIS
ncbi:hypothetical protein [Nocardia brasiliensis]|uniref:hypothetical protein n=1 Tax=Nocardia brasiliensis TaxID=37326 RepID=UPI002458A9A4|nr:hypothetical protein [Nocardia brasiliensis]